MINPLCAVVGQSGGPTAAINATLAGVIRAAASDDRIGKILGMRNGIEGFMREDFADLTEIAAPDKLDMLALTPAAALGSCRKKLPAPGTDDIFYGKLLDILKKYNIGYFFYIGGNDSMDTVAKLSAFTKSAGYDLKVIGVPKTIDNDLCGTDHTPGFGSAAKYIAVSIQEILRDCAVYTTPAVTVVEIMGRDAGWLTASAALTGPVCGIAPDYIYLPEVTFDYERFYEDVAAALARHPNVVIAVSEGVRLADGSYVGEGAHSGATDIFGHKYLAGTGKALELAVKEKFGCKVRSVELNILQRCASHIASKTDLDESMMIGAHAVEAACNGESGKMMAFVRKPGEAYGISIKSADVSEIANAVKKVPREYINERGNNVTRECIDCILPLIGGEATPLFKNGLPVHLTI